MAELSQDARSRIDAVVDQVHTLEDQLRKIQAEIKGLPFLARGFVERDISSSSGRNLTEWTVASQKMQQALSRAAQGVDADGRSLAATIAVELPKLASLRNYLSSAPQKVDKVPAAVLRPQQRAQFLEQVQQQVAQIRGLESALGAVAAALPSA